jgi:hypothetical protein
VGLFFYGMGSSSNIGELGLWAKLLKVVVGIEHENEALE